MGSGTAPWSPLALPHSLTTMTYRILVADDLAEDGLAILRTAGEVTLQKGMNEDALRQKLPGFHALVVRSATQVTARSLEPTNWR